MSRRCGRPYTKASTLDTVCADPAIQLYLAKRIEKYGRIPYEINSRIRTGAYKFLRFCEIEPTNHAFIDLVTQRKAASEYPTFNRMNKDARDKDVDRFVKRGEFVGVLTRQDGRIHLLNSPSAEDRPQPRAGQFVLHTSGFITFRAGLICRHCMTTIDLTEVEIWRRFKSDTLLRMLHVHHFFWVTCPNCRVKARYDMNEDVKPILQ